MRERLVSDHGPKVETKTVLWHDGVEFFTKRWLPALSIKPRALVIFLHGFAEHIQRYDNVCELFAAKDLEIFGYDQRGFGKSGPHFGDTTIEQQMADLDYAIHEERKRLENLYGKNKIPIYLYGHSMVIQTPSP